MKGEHVATMAEVARVAGVSATTVSHVLNGTRKVAPQTEQLVRAAVASTGHRHNLAARALARQCADTIGLAMSVVTNPYFAELVRNIEQPLRRAGCTLVLADTNDDPRLTIVGESDEKAAEDWSPFHHRDSCGCGRKKYRGSLRRPRVQH